MSSAGAGYAVHPDNDATNSGFLRDEGAVFVIFFLTDEPDKSPEGAQAYYDMIVNAKAGCGGDKCVIVSGLVNECIMGVNNTLWQFMNLFPDAAGRTRAMGVYGFVCAGGGSIGVLCAQLALDFPGQPADRHRRGGAVPAVDSGW